MISSTVENYIKQIFILMQETPSALLPMGKLASAMHVVPGTATAMVKTLADSGLVDYEPRTGLRLTRGGEQLALHVLRRHRILELFLTEVLGLDWSEVHDEAETLEHAVSDKVLERMDQLLGHPQFDPHGDPIPTAKGLLKKSRTVPLSTCPAGSMVKVARVSDQDAVFLQFLEREGLTPTIALTVHDQDELADAVSVEFEDGRRLTLGGSAAAKILVTLS